MGRGEHIIGRIVLSFILVIVAGICGLAFWYRMPAMQELAVAVWVLFTLATLWGIWHAEYRHSAISCFILALLAFGFWWGSIRPRLDRDWAPDVEYIADGKLNGNIVTFNHVRDFNWRSDNDFDARWEQRSYNVDEIVGEDLFLSYWGMPAIAHTLVSFAFKNGDHLVFSVEIRKEKNESYSSIAGFFKQYELALIAADERDIIYVRTNVRGEDVYRYPIDIPADARKELFLSYVRMGHEISTKPKFYNTITANCTTIIFEMIKAIMPGKIPMDPRIILSGYLPEYLHKIGGLYKNTAVKDMRARARITDKALQAGHVKDFSYLIRK